MHSRHRGGRSKDRALLVLNLGARWERVVNDTPLPLDPRERAPVSIVHEAGWAPRKVWNGVENIPLT